MKMILSIKRARDVKALVIILPRPLPRALYTGGLEPKSTSDLQWRKKYTLGKLMWPKRSARNHGIY